MSWFRHRCWFCGHVSRDMDFIVGDGDYQCKDRDACQIRRWERFPWERDDVLKLTRGQLRTLRGVRRP